ncbi:MAG: T9SS type A sorting domain-containing protein, partial [Candidatus Eisenbacteria bacterium]|nr:T9SS type A sorting domain-containing protein [Candidatus Eisenbacteria bacterium]
DPFATFEHAIDLAQPGDTLFVRGGTYMLNEPITLDKAGTNGDPIRLWAYAGEEPILDFSSNPRHANPPQPREDDTIAGTSDALGIFVAPGSDWWHLRGLTIRRAPYYGVRVYGSHNIFEMLVLFDHKAAGLELTGKEGWSPSDNLVLNCDSYHNFDPQTNGEDADGFAAKFDDLGPDNVFSGLRAWHNSDDGFDFWHAVHPVLIEHCWSFDNGFFRPEWQDSVSGSWRGDGLGFKLGQDASELVLNHDVAFGNKAFGIHSNGNNSVGGVTINNATLVNNAKNGNPIQIQLDDGSPHTVRNTIAFDVDGAGVTNFDPQVDDQYNTWNGIGVSEADFVSLDMDQLLLDATAPRGPGGSLPHIGLHLDPSSHLIDAGIDVGLPYNGDAPDLGAFETEGTSAIGPGHFVQQAPWRLSVAPNPFVSDTALRFELEAAGPVRVAVFDAQGRRVRVLAADRLPAGLHSVAWDGCDAEGRRLPSGLYLLRVVSGERSAETKLLRLR